MQLKRNTTSQKTREAVPAAVMWPRIVVIMCTFILVVIGLVMVFSASSIMNIDAEVDAHADAAKQLFFAAVGLVLCLALARVIPYGVWRGLLTWVVFGISLVLLVLTAAIGTEGLGAQRWLTLGPLNLQPSEFAKIGILLAAAKLVSEYQEGTLAPRTFLFAFAALNIMLVALVFVAQSDLGTTIICFIGMFAILWLSEVPLRFLGIYAAVFAVPAAIGLTQGYRLERLMSFTHPWDDYYGSGYQIIHSMYAFAQGGIFGTGLGNSAEKYLYLPEASTDFIYAVIGEELGLVGALLVLGLFVALLLAGLRMAQMAPDRFGAVLCGSFSIIIVFQAFLNIGCVIGVLPITGKPLPFVSAGGSSLIASLIMVGIMLSVSHASGESPLYRERRQEIHPVGWDDYGQRSTRTRFSRAASLPSRGMRGGWDTRVGAYPGEARYRHDRNSGRQRRILRERGR